MRTGSARVTTRSTKRCALGARAGRVAVVEVGAGTAVPTVRAFSERTGDDVIRINVREAHARRADVIGLPGGALETLRALDAAWRRD
ncbi:NAD-dependent deacetylase domain protein [Burkholderia pseudomallei MSHR456]|nr:NAD-dependent deacetylase domain protein [Burkholderia pseudomallei MSHR456]